MNVFLIGAGPMAALHADVLAAMDVEVTIVATSATRAEPLAKKHGMAFYDKGLQGALTDLPRPDAAIVALPVNKLAQAGCALAKAGVPRILLEKPGALNADELNAVEDAAQASGAEVFIAYNRRFFTSVMEARRRIAAAERVLSVNFEFCENVDVISGLPTPDEIKQAWVIANSSHVIDLAFHLCGQPTKWHHETHGSLPWHTAGADFRGMGETEAGAQFSYFADWRGPGRWGLEIVLPHERLILRPMEALEVMARGSFSAQPVTLEGDLDQRFKPGLYAQTEGFLAPQVSPVLVTLAQQRQAMDQVYQPMAGYSRPMA